MRLFIQRVKRASVSVDGQIVGQCGHGLCVLAGARKSRRSSFIDAELPNKAEPTTGKFTAVI